MSTNFYLGTAARKTFFAFQSLVRNTITIPAVPSGTRGIVEHEMAGSLMLRPHGIPFSFEMRKCDVNIVTCRDVRHVAKGTTGTIIKVNHDGSVVFLPNGGRRRYQIPQDSFHATTLVSLPELPLHATGEVDCLLSNGSLVARFRRENSGRYLYNLPLNSYEFGYLRIPNGGEEVYWGDVDFNIELAPTPQPQYMITSIKGFCLKHQIEAILSQDLLRLRIEDKHHRVCFMLEHAELMPL